MGSCRYLLGLMVVAGLMVFVGCGEDEVGAGIADDCPGDECVACDEHRDCTGGSFCHGTEGVCVAVDCGGDDDCPDDTRCLEETGTCIGAVCEPGERECAGDGGAIEVCNSEGTGFYDARECPSGECSFGSCRCEESDDCFGGELCTDTGVCECASQTYCGETLVCCGSDEVCDVVDGDDEETVEQCVPACAGERCGFDGEVCCEGENPVCGPGGECAPSCEGEGDLCGEDFDECCPAGDVCVFGECATPGQECEQFTDCDFGEYCDDGLGKCLPDDFPDDLVCEDEYDFDDVQPEEMWNWEGVDVDGTMYTNVMMTPLVADMDGSGTPNVIFNAYASNTSIPVVVDGETGDTIYVNNTHDTDFGSQLSVADITGNGLPEIVAIENGDQAIGVIKNIVDCSWDDVADDDEGCYLWWNDEDVNAHQPAPVVADLNANDDIEIIMGDAILDGETGDLLARLDAGGYGYTTAVDITGDGRLEVLGAGCLYSLDGDDELQELWCTDDPIASAGRRFVAAGDLTDDGEPEFVITGDGTAYVVAADDGQVLYEFPIYGGGDGGSPIIADFDGDGSSEFGVAGANCYTVYDLDCIDPDADGPDDLMEDQPGCERPEIDTCGNGRHCACEDLEDTMGTGDGVLWSIYVQDESSARTGSSVFDFQGNGRNEVVYNDECLLMVLDGQDGSPYFVRGNTNRTSSEYPIIADVTGDNQTNIVVSANNDQFGRDCEDPINDQPERFPECHPDGDDSRPQWCDEGTTGVIALQDPQDRWVRTRSVWNHFDYYIDNAADDTGAVPTSPDMPWDSHNTFRANQQGEVPLNAPDVVISNVQVDSLACPPDVTFQATIQNQGMAAIPEGMPVSLYLLDSSASGGELVETVTIDQAISPGGVAQVQFSYDVAFSQFNNEMDFQIAANDDGAGGEPVRDCNPDNAVTLIEDVICTYAG